MSQKQVGKIYKSCGDTQCFFSAAKAEFLFMPKSREQKQEIIKDLQDKIARQKASVFVDFGASPAKKIFQFRDELKTAGCLMQVVKKSLLEKALQQVQGEFLEKIKDIKGQIAMIFGFTDEVSPAKISYYASKKNDQIKILAGILGKDFLGQERVMELAKLPSKPELLGKLLSSMQAPISNFVYALNGNIKGLTTILFRISETKK